MSPSDPHPDRILPHGFYDPSSNLHPYECDGPGKCEHCDHTISLDHNPQTCELCKGDAEQ